MVFRLLILIKTTCDRWKKDNDEMIHNKANVKYNLKCLSSFANDNPNQSTSIALLRQDSNVVFHGAKLLGYICKRTISIMTTMARAHIQINTANIAVATTVTKRMEMMIQHIIKKKWNNYSQNV